MRTDEERRAQYEVDRQEAARLAEAAAAALRRHGLGPDGRRAAPSRSKPATVRLLVNVGGMRVDDAAATVGWMPGRAMEALRRMPLGRSRVSI